MECQVCKTDIWKYGQNNSVEVAVVDGYGKIHYVCKHHAKEILGESIKCYNCGSRKNERGTEWCEDYHVSEWEIKCSVCGKLIGHHFLGEYTKYVSEDDDIGIEMFED